MGNIRALRATSVWTTWKMWGSCVQDVRIRVHMFWCTKCSSLRWKSWSSQFDDIYTLMYTQLFVNFATMDAQLSPSWTNHNGRNYVSQSHILSLISLHQLRWVWSKKCILLGFILLLAITQYQFDCKMFDMHFESFSYCHSNIIFS